MKKMGNKIAIICCLACFSLVGRSTVLADQGWQTNQQSFSQNLRPESPQTCTLQPPLTREERVTTDLRQEDFSPDRFRRGLGNNLGNNLGNFGDNNFGQDTPAPVESIAVASPTNYGDRFFGDIYGQPAYHAPIVVLHETVATLRQTLNFFQSPQRDEANQASYHTLISLDGEIIYIVPPDKRAFGAGNSLFVSQGVRQIINQETGEVANQLDDQLDDQFVEESVKTNLDYPPSVNNFAYHVSLETPRDGLNNAQTHSGYTNAQYRSLAWLVAKTGVPEDRITTHQGVDRSGERIYPRSFDRAYFLAWYQVFPKTQEIFIGCLDPQTPSP
ncbi:MAG: N-acetylmuramoyl-L-alanine amidase [Coleofasciculaceae cyanobacterium SM2_1_6]|nr:N-acetylmuramoyl-L-alanine amidase [Coleofasciculaceae cyanobacterium SM2_1_6]